MSNELDLSSLNQLYERRSHELKAVKALVKQKRDETQKYIDLCGDEPNFPLLKEVLSSKLTKLENELNEVRSRVKSLRQRKLDLNVSKEKSSEINILIGENSKVVEDLKQQVLNKTKELEPLREDLAKKAEDFSKKQKEIDTIKNLILDSQQKRDQLVKELKELLEMEKSLQNQQTSLKNAINETKNEINEVKSIISPSSLLELQKEVEKLEQQLGNSDVTESNEIIIQSINELDAQYREQIESAMAKLESLQQSFQTLTEKASEEDKQHHLRITESRLKLDRLKQSNNLLRSTIEEMELSIPQTLGPINREIEQWRQKVSFAVQTGKDNEKKLNQQRIHSEELLADSELHLKEIQEENVRIKVSIAHHSKVLAEKEQELHRIKQVYEETNLKKEKFDEDISKNKNKLQELSNDIIIINEKIKKSENDLSSFQKNAEEELLQLRKLAEELEVKATLIPKEVELNSSFVNEEELRESIKSLEEELVRRESELNLIKTQYDESEKTRLRFETALRLIADLEDEETILKEELRMLRSRFDITIKQLQQRN